MTFALWEYACNGHEPKHCMKFLKSITLITTVFSLSLFSCLEKENALLSDPKATYSELKTRTEEHLNCLIQTLGYKFDSLNLTDVLINGHPPEMSLDEFLSFENPDSSREYDWMCPSHFDWTDTTKGESWQITYYCGNREYISNGRDVTFQKMDLEGNRFEILSKKFVLDTTTTIEEFHTFFPVGMLDGILESEKNPQDDGLVWCRVILRWPFDDQWIFRFRNGHLVSVELWWLLC